MTRTMATSRSLIADLPNEELWKLVRRFNKQTSHVKAISHADPSVFDVCLGRHR